MLDCHSSILPTNCTSGHSLPRCKPKTGLTLPTSGRLQAGLEGGTLCLCLGHTLPLSSRQGAVTKQVFLCHRVGGLCFSPFAGNCWLPFPLQPRRLPLHAGNASFPRKAVRGKTMRAVPSPHVEAHGKGVFTWMGKTPLCQDRDPHFGCGCPRACL